MLALKDQIFVRIDVPDTDPITLRELARAITLILEMSLAILFIIAQVALVAWHIGRGVVEVWVGIGNWLNTMFIDLCSQIAGYTLEFGRYWQG